MGSSYEKWFNHSTYDHSGVKSLLTGDDESCQKPPPSRTMMEQGGRHFGLQIEERSWTIG
jgi:hypothetical protein